MSHFVVMVIGENVEEQLAPYQENNMGDCPPEYMKFEDKEDEYIEEWEANKKTIRDWRPKVNMEISQELYDLLNKNGTVVIPEYLPDFLEMIREKQKNTAIFRLSKEEQEKQNRWCSKPIDVEVVRLSLVFEGEIPTDKIYEVELKKISHRDIPIQDYYKDYDKYMKDYHGLEKDEEVGRYGYWYNPNAKWDWYVIGGRWKGQLILKKGCQGEEGVSGVFDNDPMYEGGVDQALKGDIDWDVLKEAQKKNLEEQWEKYENGDNFALFGYPKDITKEKYMSANLGYGLSCYAVIKDGKWYSKGEMGWWGMSDDAMTDFEWQRELEKLIDELDEDELITIVDCHI